VKTLLLLFALSTSAIPPDLVDIVRQIEHLPAGPSESARLAQFFDLYWAAKMRMAPGLAVAVGYTGVEARLPDYSQETFDFSTRLTHIELAALQSIDRAKLTPAEQLNYDLLRRKFEGSIEGERFLDLNTYIVIDHMSDGITGVLETIGYMPARNAADYEKMLMLMRGFPRVAEQGMALLAEGLKRGITPPRVTLQHVAERIEPDLTDDPLKNPLVEPFRHMPDTIPAAERERLLREAHDALQQQVVPELRKLHDYLAKTYVPNARDYVAVSDLPDGKAYYASMLRHYTTTNLTPDEIHDLGLAEVKRIRAEMDAVIASTGFKGTFAEFTTFLRTDPRFFYDKPEDVLAGYRDIAKRIDPQLTKLFGRLPRLPYGVKAMTAGSQSAPSALYSNGTLAAGRPGWMLVNTFDLKARPKWGMESLAAHESVPGHHLQYSLAEEIGELPQWRKWDVYPVFSEGWGLYAETIGGELGLYTDPYQKFGQLNNEMWRAIRLVVDTGLHAKGWSRQQAIDYCRANSAKTEREIANEVDRYIVQPGSVPAYKIGELKIRELRRYAEKELGAKFDIRAFHDLILGGGQLPLDLLEKRVKAWVAESVGPPDLAGIARQIEHLPAGPSESARLARLFDLYWAARMHEMPDLASSFGYRGLEGRLPDFSAETLAFEHRLSHIELAALSSIDRAKLTPAEQLNDDLLRRSLELEIEGERFGSLDPWRNDYLLVDQMNDRIGGALASIADMPARTAADYEAMLSMLRGFPRLVEQGMARLDEGLRRGITPPRVTLRAVAGRVLVALPDDPAKSSLLEPFRHMPETIPAAERERLLSQAHEAMRRDVAPALHKLHDYLAKTYVPNARESVSVSALPDGKAYYTHLLHYYTTTNLGPEQIHELGLAEVKRIRGEMDALIASTGFKGSFDDFTKFLRTDPKFFYDKPEDMLAGYRDIAKRIDPALPKLFGRLPRLPYGIKAMPAGSESQPSALYDAGALADGRPGWMLVNTFDLKARPKWGMESLAAHEAVPGHHLQISLAEEIGDLPEWRKWVVYPVFAEGWGLYAETIGGELGLYTDPYQKFGQLNNEMWRAIRLVVDTGLHAKGWSRQQAIDYCRANSAKTEREIENEVDRYIVQPGSVPCYKIGELKIRELRRYAEKELGAKFDVRAFHDLILGGGQLPLDLLEKRVKAWVAESGITR
jgi:uncharacterized protein (DUF885 family)